MAKEKKGVVLEETVETKPDADSLAGLALRVAALEALFEDEEEEAERTTAELEAEHGPILVCPNCGSFRFHVPEFIMRMHADGYVEEEQAEAHCLSCHWQGGFDGLKAKGGSVL